MTAYYNEFDPGAAEWLRELIKAGLIAPGEVDERSILDVRADELSGFTQCHFFAGIGGWSCALRRAGWPDDRAVWTGSPPCQPFSVAGEGKGQSDERHLAPHFVELVRDARPRVLFGEQVASSAVFGKAAGSPKRGPARPPAWAWLDDLSDRLEAAHYAVGASDIPAAGVGAPHIRQRTFFGAYDLRPAASGVDDRHDEPQRPAGNETRLGNIGGSGSPSGVVNGISAGLERHGRHGRDGNQPGRLHTQPHGSAGSAGTSDRMADLHSNGCGQGRQRFTPSGNDGAIRDGSAHRMADARCAGDERVCRSRQASGTPAAPKGETREREWSRPADWPSSSPGRVANSDRAGPLPSPQRRVHCSEESPGSRNGKLERHGSAGPGIGHNRPGPLDGFWGDSDWLFCRDGKWRPVEPGTRPLAHGVPTRVGLLRGYGNAISPQPAEEFIRAFQDVIAQLETNHP